MLSLGNMLATVIDVLGIWILFDRFGQLNDWRLPEILMFYGMIHIAFAFAESAGRGFDIFPRLIKSGEFDRFLLRPRTTALQVAGHQLQMIRLGRLTQGLLVILWASSQLKLHWTLAHVWLALFAMFGGFCLFYGLFILQATLAFWSTETLEIMNTVTYGGTETAQYPLVIYPKWFRRFFTFVVPLAAVNYFPTLVLLNRADPLGSPVWFRWSSPVIGILFLFACLRIWSFGVQHYHSTGS